jgi:predicted RNase H-like HicB family nuclease
LSKGNIWLPIETAPKDGSAILLLSAPYEDAQTGAHPAKVAIGHWWPEGSSWVPEGPHKEKEVYTLQQAGVWLSGGGWFQPNEVTHWAPLPLPPETALQSKNKYSFHVVWSDEDNVYFARCPEFPGLLVHGDTPEEAIREAGVALEGVIEVYKESNLQLPEPTATGRLIKEKNKLD